MGLRRLGWQLAIVPVIAYCLECLGTYIVLPNRDEVVEASLDDLKTALKEAGANVSLIEFNLHTTNIFHC